MPDDELAAFIGKPFDEKGLGPESYNCWGLARAVLALQAIHLPAFTEGWERSTSPEARACIVQGREAFVELWREWEAVQRPERWDLVLFGNPKTPHHLGVMLNDEDFIHAHRGIGVNVTRLTDPRWAHRIAGFYRHRPAPLPHL